MESHSLSNEMKAQAAQVIAQRTLPLASVHAVLYLALLFGTTQTPKSSTVATSFGIYIFVLSLVTLFTSNRFRKTKPSAGGRWTLYGLLLLLGASWGTLCAVTQYSLALGWTSFFVILLTLFVSASHLATLVPDIRVLSLFQALVLVPAAIVNLTMIGGFQGYAIGFFLLGFATVISGIGWIQYKQYWQMSKNHDRLQAMFNSMPGTLAWVNSAKQFLGMNDKLSDVMATSKDGDDQRSAINSFIDRIFNSNDENVSGFVDLKKRKFFMIGQKYNYNNEAMVLGVDVTDQHLVQEQLEFQRAQSHNSARFASLGEVIGEIMEDLPASADNMSDEIKTVWPLIHRLSLSQYEKEEKDLCLNELINDVSLYFVSKAKTNGIDFEVVQSDDNLKMKAHSGDIILALLSLVSNAFEAVEEADKRSVSIKLSKLNGEAQIHINDSGPGIPDYLNEIIFEPNFTTKKPSDSTGLGLSLAKQLVEGHGGTLKLTSQSPTQFTVSFPNL